MKINSSEYVLAYHMKLIGIFTKEKNHFKGKKPAELFKINSTDYLQIKFKMGEDF